MAEKSRLLYLDLYDWYAGEYFEFETHGTEYAAVTKLRFDDDGYPCYITEAISKEDILMAMEEEGTMVPVYDVVYYVPERNTWMDDVGCSHLDEKTLSEYEDLYDEESPDEVTLSGGYLKIA